MSAIPVRQNAISVDFLNACLTYCHDSGVLTWRQRPVEHFARAKDFLTWNKKWADKEAGSIDRNHNGITYRTIWICGYKYYAHRIAYAMIHKEWPSLEVDHLNGNGLDNRASNLRLADRSLNLRNKKMRSDNTSGSNGVHWCNKREKWVAQIHLNNKKVPLGRFVSKSDAIIARKNAEIGQNYTSRNGVKQ
jgi:hypothetical protein